jgi:hypothetical protein
MEEFTQSREGGKDAKKDVIADNVADFVSLCVFATFAPLRELPSSAIGAAALDHPKPGPSKVID